jgi:hypothetical protein
VRVRAHVTLRVRHRLPDGTDWAYIYPSDAQRRKRGDYLLVRVIVHTLTDPARPGYGAPHRLLTTLLVPQAAPALDLICATMATTTWFLAAYPNGSYMRSARRSRRTLRKAIRIVMPHDARVSTLCASTRAR